MKQAIQLTVLISLFFITACTNKLTVRGEFPSPLIAPLPYSVSLYYPDEFKKFSYTEKGKDREKWLIKDGEAQANLFDKVLNKMFTSTVKLNSPPSEGSAPTTDLVIIPTVYDFQYTVPRETKVKIYEVWIKYNIRVEDSYGKIIADWIMTAYGKTPSGFLKSDKESMNQAIVMALRDAGVNLAFSFTQVPEIHNWLTQNPSRQQHKQAQVVPPTVEGSL